MEAKGVSKSPPSSLYCIDLNETCEETIILIHGFSSSHREYTFVQPFLSNYHLLLPDLPGHGGSIGIPLKTLPDAADLVAELIRREAHGGRAHVVGLSMGGAISLILAHRHPDVVRTLFVTGVPVSSLRSLPKGSPSSLPSAPPAKRSWTRKLVPYVLAFIKPVLWAPRPIQKWVVRLWGMEIPDGLIEDVRRNLQFHTSKTASTQIGKIDFRPFASLRTRTLAVAGASHDSVDGIRSLGRIVRRGNPESKAIAIPGGIHTWDMQWPELFADCVKAWIMAKALPKKIEVLE